MGRVFIEYIEQAFDEGRPADLQRPTAGKTEEKARQGELIFTCKHCQIHLADNTDFISKVSLATFLINTRFF